MKSYKYQWTPQYYLLHLQFNNPSRIQFEAVLIARSALAPQVLPVGIVTAFAGAPLFLYLLIKGDRGI